MPQPTPYQYVKLGSNLEFLRGVCSVAMMQTTSLAGFPHLMANLPAGHYSVVRVVEAAKAVLIQLEELKFEKSLAAAEPFRAMLHEMEGYLGQAKTPHGAYLNDPFAERLVELSKEVTAVLKQELAAAREPVAHASLRAAQS